MLVKLLHVYGFMLQNERIHKLSDLPESDSVDYSCDSLQDCSVLLQQTSFILTLCFSNSGFIIPKGGWVIMATAGSISNSGAYTECCAPS